MNEIRVCCDPSVEHENRGVFRDGGVWYLDEPALRGGLMSIVAGLNGKHGAGTHWLEQRPYKGESMPVYH